MIVCFEGPSGVGKTKLGQLLSDNFQIVPEVNLLFERKQVEDEYWYYERQVDRFKMCKRVSQDSILDGDIFQPLWYNWVYDYPVGFPSEEETNNFYLEKILNNKISFPDLYIIFYTELAEIRKRKENDKTRKRSNFEKHLQFIEPQKKYFKFLKEHTTLNVEFVNYDDIDIAKNEVMSLVNSYDKQEMDEEKIFKNIIKWLKVNN